MTDVVIVTGCGSRGGIGFATARLLAGRGCRLVITSTTERIQERIEELARGGAQVAALSGDLGDERFAEELVRLCLGRFGRVDGLVNNAGMGRIGAPEAVKPFVEFTADEWRTSLRTNLFTAVNLCRAAVPAMRAAGHGRIVNVATTTGPVVANPGESPYAAAKSAIIGLTRTLALELACEGITVNAVAPGWIETEASTPEELHAARAAPPRRAGRPEEVAEAIGFLLSRGASYVNGAMLVVDGGNCLLEKKSG